MHLYSLLLLPLATVTGFISTGFISTAFIRAPISSLAASGYTCVSPPLEASLVAEIDSLLEERNDARRDRDYDAADAIRRTLYQEFKVNIYDRDREYEIVEESSGRGGQGGQDYVSGGGFRTQEDFGDLGHDYSRSTKDGATLTDEKMDAINNMLRERLQAKLTRDFEEADRIQIALETELGVLVNDGRKEWRADGGDFNVYERLGRPGPGEDADLESKVTPLLRERMALRKDRDYDGADQIKLQLRNEFSVFIDDRQRTWTVSSRRADETPAVWRRGDQGSESDELVETIEGLIAERAAAKKTRDYNTSDEIHERLRTEFDVYTNDRLMTWSIGHSPMVYSRGGNTPEGEAPEFAAEVITLINERSEAKAQRNYDLADGIRDRLKSEYNVFCDDKQFEWRIDGGERRWGGGGRR